MGEIADLQIGLALRNGRIPPTLATSICTQIFAVVEYGGLGEVSTGQHFIMEAFEHCSSGGRASLVLYGRDEWSAVASWPARHQFRWNTDSDEMNVRNILAFVLARAGLKLEVISQSSVITGYYPDFTVNPGNRGEAVVAKLLSLVPDALFVEGNKAYLLDPQADDSPLYSYGGEHRVLDGKYYNSAWKLNRVQVEGLDVETGAPIVADSFAWDEIGRMYDRLAQVEDVNINTVAGASARGESCLRKAEIESGSGFIRVTVNCGQQLYDVVDITDERAGLESVKRRILGMALIFSPQLGEYEQCLLLGAV